MESKPVEFRHSPACCKSQNACPAIPSASAEKGGDVYYSRGAAMKDSLLRPLLLTLLFVSLISFACQTPSSEPPTFAPSPPAPTEEIPAETKSEEGLPTFPIVVVDDLGRKITIQHLPQRIVSLAPSNTEILFALGLGDKIVGTTDYCDYPEAAKAKPRVAGYSNPNIEKLMSLEPDLIVAESIHERMVLPALERLGLTVIVTSATSLDTILHDVELIGQVTGKSVTAAQLTENMRKRIEAVTEKTRNIQIEQRPRVLYVCWHNPIWTMGSDTFIDDLIWKAGGMNVFASDFKKSRAVSLEAVIDKDPQIIIISGMGTTGGLIYNSIIKEARLRDVSAIADNRVYKISDANLIERPGPRIVDGLDEVAKYIHPEIFGIPASISK